MPIVKVKEATMKTLEDFIQRLRDDAAFEKQAQAFDRGDDLIAFVKREGYDFTLEQLMNEFEPEENLPAETGGLAPAPAEVNASPSLRPDQAAIPGQPEAVSGSERGAGLVKRLNDDSSREPPVERLLQLKAAALPPEPKAEPGIGLFRGGGGRHRGFSSQRLKSISEEDSQTAVDSLIKPGDSD
jgi:predicted ribosomally synthesized peptide with nif11-like leader